MASSRSFIDPERLPYRPCVGIMVLNQDGLVWVGRRIIVLEDKVKDKTQLWQMPQGGINDGEEAETAARRELYEETGMHTVSLLAEAPHWITYDLPAELRGLALKNKYRGQSQKWFAYRFEGQESEIIINPPPDNHTAEFDDWAWKPMSSLPLLIVPFKRDVYEQIIKIFCHLV